MHRDSDLERFEHACLVLMLIGLAIGALFIASEIERPVARQQSAEMGR